MKTTFTLLIAVVILSISCSTSPQISKFSDNPASPAVVKTSQKNSLKPNSAIVISQQANLRDGRKSSANVIQTVAMDSEVEVIKQQGAWYYVKVENDIQGWMHGNTLRLQNYDISLPVSRQTPKPQPRITPEQEINNSGATAKCRDGSLSYSAHRRGTCSHHGGVAVWY